MWFVRLFSVLLVVAVLVGGVVGAVLSVRRSEDVRARRAALAVGLDRTDAVVDCVESSRVLEERLESYVDHYNEDDDYGARYVASATAPSMNRCNVAVLARGRDPWVEVISAVARYEEARDAVAGAMNLFRAALAFHSQDAQHVEATRDALTLADRAWVDAENRLTDAFYLRTRGVSALFEQVLQDEGGRERDLAVERVFHAIEEMKYAWHHASDDASSAAALRVAIANFEQRVIVLPPDAGNAHFQIAAHALDQEIRFVTANGLPTIEPTHEAALRIELDHAYDECAPAVRLRGR